MGAMSIIQSLQTLQNTLKGCTATSDLLSKALKVTGAELVTNQLASIKATIASEGLSKTQKALTLTTKSLSLALKAIPLMLVIGLITELVLHWEDLVGWFDKTFPALKKMGGLMNVLKGAVIGLGKAIVHWLTNPIKTLAEVIKKVLAGDFAGAAQAAIDGIKNQFTGLGDAFKEGFTNQVNEGLEEMARKQAATDDEMLTHHKNMITKQKNADGTYRKEYIEANKKMFENRKKMYKEGSKEYNKVLEEEAAFHQQVEDAKTAATKKGAADRTKAAKEAAKQAAKATEEEAKKEKERQKANADATKNMYDAYYKDFQEDIKEELRQAGLEVEKYSEGPLLELVEALAKVERLQKEIYGGETRKAAEDLFNSLDENVKKIIKSVEDVDEVIKNGGYISYGLQQIKEDFEQTFGNETELETFQKNFEAFQMSCTAIARKYTNDIRVAHEELYKKIAEGAKNTGQAVVKNASNIYNNLLDYLKEINVDVEPVRYRFSGLINTKETEKKLEKVKQLWVDAAEKINKEIQFTEDHWNEYIKKMIQLYGEDSQKYKDAVQEKIEALKKLKQLQDEVNKRAATPTSGENDYNGDNNPDAPKPKKQLWYGKGETDASGKEYSIVDNLANLFTELDEMVLAPAMDTFSMYMDFAIEETEQKLAEVEKLHDKALDKVDESAEKIKELNDSLKDSSNTNIEVTKQQLADEQLLYAQRLAEEQKLAQEEKALKNKQAKQEAQARKMELGYQMVMAIANTAQGASKALAQWGWPLGAVFAGVMAALGAVQVALIAKQIGAIKPVKYAEGGLLEGPSHAQGGIRLGNIEVEGGEAIINKRSTERYRGLLDAINAAGNGGKHTLADKKIRKYADGGQLNFDRADENLRTNANTNRLINAIDGINMQPVVSVKDIWRAEDRLVHVRSLAGKTTH
jgi:hypothetical protein